jgi:hypothetical protein
MAARDQSPYRVDGAGTAGPILDVPLSLVEFIEENLGYGAGSANSPRSLQQTATTINQVTIAGEAYRLIDYFQD